MLKAGTVFWITGLSGSGKSTLATCLHQELQNLKQSSIILDGDELRKALGAASRKNENYTREKRLELALQYSRLAKLISGQGINVIVATISMFDEVYTHNRGTIDRYIEIFVDTPTAVLKERNSKDLYSLQLKGEIQGLAGIDVEIDIPKEPSLTIKYSEDQGITKTVRSIIELWEMTNAN